MPEQEKHKGILDCAMHSSGGVHDWKEVHRIPQKNNQQYVTSQCACCASVRIQLTNEHDIVIEEPLPPTLTPAIIETRARYTR